MHGQGTRTDAAGTILEKGFWVKGEFQVTDEPDISGDVAVAEEAPAVLVD